VLDPGGDQHVADARQVQTAVAFELEEQLGRAGIRISTSSGSRVWMR
jgi:hypothetical protein